MKYELINSYKLTPLSIRDVVDSGNSIQFTYHDGPKVEILGNASADYAVDFIDADTQVNVYSTTIKNNMWCAALPKYYVNWKLIVKQNEVVVAQDSLSLKDKMVKIVLDTQSLGDLLAFVGVVENFRKKHECKLTCVVFNKALVELYAASYPQIKFVSIDQNNEEYYAIYKIGCFVDWQFRIEADPKTLFLVDVAANILGVESTGIKPELFFKKLPPRQKKYVCIGTQSTAQCKYWNNPDGWSDVVKYLNKLGYDVWCIDQHSSFGVSGHVNRMPKGCIDKTGNFSILERLAQLDGAEFFIGLSSGLSWLAWAANKPVVLVSGFTDEITEFSTPYRVINKSVCHGCWNDPTCKFDKNDWLWCPRGKQFECSKLITSNMVIEQIDRVLGVSNSST